MKLLFDAKFIQVYNGVRNLCNLAVLA